MARDGGRRGGREGVLRRRRVPEREARKVLEVPQQFIFTMKDLRKVFPPNREVLKGIWLSFLPGAKIGVLGANGAGKSTVLKIMAGIETEFLGEAFSAEGTRVGFLPQEPTLDPAKDVVGNVEEGVAEIRAVLQRFDDVSAKMAEPMPDDALRKLLEVGRE